MNAQEEQLIAAIQRESQTFQEYYLWLQQSMPPAFHEEVSIENMMIITHNLMHFDLQDCFSTINLKRGSIVLCLDSPDVDLRILHDYSMFGIKNYMTFVSNQPLPFPGASAKLRIATIYYTEAIEITEKPYPNESIEELKVLVKQHNPELTDNEFYSLLKSINTRFLKALSPQRLGLAIDMFFRAKTRDNCQYEVLYDEKWAEKDKPSMQIVLAWRNTPKHNFLYRLARTIHRNGLIIKRVNATYVDPYSRQSILIMSIGLHGTNNKAAWEVADIPTFLREFITVKYFNDTDMIEDVFVNPKIINGNMGNLLRAMITFIHQALLQVDVNIYTLDNIGEALCRHPELTEKICAAFDHKFNPKHPDLKKFEEVRLAFLNDVAKLDTGNEINDTRRKNVLYQAMNFVSHTLKTNFYRNNLSSFSFRLDPKYLDAIPFDRPAKFPEMPYAIFFIKGMHYFGFHIRFKDLARGGLRTVFPKYKEQMLAERNNVFTECYNLALTQQMKNKDIPEGGSKAIIFLKPYDQLESEAEILKKELTAAKIDPQIIEKKLESFSKDQNLEYLYQTQRSFIESLLTIVNSEPDGTLKAKDIVDYLKKPEYLYLGPDENMHDSMIQWIADISKKFQYKPGTAFISSKPKSGINHKEYGVTSLGINVYMHEVLKCLGINPSKDTFTIKISGGPDGDVAGNQIKNLHKFYPHTAKLIAITDISGTISDPKGLDLKILTELFEQGKPINQYPPEKLSEGGYLVDKFAKRYPTALVQQTLRWKKKNGKAEEEWISGSDMNYLWRHSLHQISADIFIPAGGRPRTLNESNYKDFLDAKGVPTARGIIEGANLYLTPEARRILEKLGVLIIKDSSANKTGVICSSFEVLCGLALGDKEFAAHKDVLVKEILERITQCAAQEAHLLLQTHKETGDYLTDISSRTSKLINTFTYQILDYLEPITLSHDVNDTLIQNFLNYCLPTLREKYTDNLLNLIPEQHKKAIIACHIAAQVVYQKGLSWSPSIVDILPLLLKQ